MADDIIRLIEKAGLPVTRATYIEVNWGNPLPEWTAELEMELPEELQDWTLFKEENGVLVLK